MNHTHDDPRVTAYVFGELPSDQMAAFERELEGSAELKQEVAAIRDALAALRSEFESRSTDVSQAHRRAVEHAIEQRALHQVTPVAPATSQRHDRIAKRGAILSLLAASVLLAAGLTYPYWRSQSASELSMNEPSGAKSSRDFGSAATTQPSEVDEQAVTWFERIDQESSVKELARSRTALAASQEAESESLGGGPAQLKDLFGTDAKTPSADESTVASTPAPFGATQYDIADGFADHARADRSRIESMRSNQLEAKDPSAASITESRAALPGYAAGPNQRRARGLAHPGQVGDGNADIGFDSLQLDDSAAIELHADDYTMEMAPAFANAAPTVDALEANTSGGYAKALPAESFGFAPQSSPVSGLEATRDMMEMDDAMEMGMGMGGMMGMDVAGGDRYARIEDNPFVKVSQAPLSTFSIDVDTASYSKIRSLLRNNTLPRPDAVRIEELLNYFDYDYPGPTDSHPFAASMEIAQCPWNQDHRLARIGIQAREIETQRPSSNLVFLLDVSGSMDEPDKLPLVVEGMKLLTDQLTENDKVAIVVYAGAAGVVLDATRGDKKQVITAALERLRAGGSTNGGEGIVLAYQIARDHFITGGTNRVILCSDGDFNVGVTGTDELVRIAKENAGSNIFLSVLGFGNGNLNDEMMETLSNDGNGNYAFIDSKREAEKVFVEELGGTLVTVAKDVKIQIEFNPKKVAAYRLIGYENRILEAEDFNDDSKDAGEIGAGHTVTALYELIPAGSTPEFAPLDSLRYQIPNRPSEFADSDEALTLKLRYKQPEGDTSTLMEVPVVDDGKSFVQCDRDFQFAAAVAGFGMLLRNSPHRGNVTFEDVQAIASESAKGDDFGYRTEFVELVKQARVLRGQ